MNLLGTTIIVLLSLLIPLTNAAYSYQGEVNKSGINNVRVLKSTDSPFRCDAFNNQEGQLFIVYAEGTVRVLCLIPTQRPRNYRDVVIRNLTEGQKDMVNRYLNSQ